MSRGRKNVTANSVPDRTFSGTSENSWALRSRNFGPLLKLMRASRVKSGTLEQTRLAGATSGVLTQTHSSRAPVAALKPDHRAYLTGGAKKIGTLSHRSAGRRTAVRSPFLCL